MVEVFDEVEKYSLNKDESTNFPWLFKPGKKAASIFN
jgi:hypothetical protein